MGKCEHLRICEPWPNFGPHITRSHGREGVIHSFSRSTSTSTSKPTTMSSTTITAIVQRTRSTLNMMHRGNIAQAPKVMKALIRAAEDVNNAFVDSKYVKGALAANRDLLAPQLEPYVYLTEQDKPIIGVCNIHILDGKFLTAQALYSDTDEYINLINEELEIGILEDTIIFLANTLSLGVYSAPDLNTWVSENYVASRKRGRFNEHFRSSDYTGNARKTLLSQASVDAIIKDGIFNKGKGVIGEDATLPAAISNKAKKVDCGPKAHVLPPPKVHSQVHSHVHSHVLHHVLPPVRHHVRPPVPSPVHVPPPVLPNVDNIIDGLAKELTDLVEVKDKRLDLVVKQDDVTEYEEFFTEYKNMKEYLAGVIEHLRAYKVEKANIMAHIALRQAEIIELRKLCTQPM